MKNPWLRWLPVALFGIVWTAGWTLVWQHYLFERLGRVAQSGIVFFEAESAELRSVRVIAVVTLIMVGIGYFLLVQSSVVRPHSRPGGVILRLLGAATTTIALSLLILFPSTRDVVVDRQARVVSLESRWLYASESQALRYDEILRVGLRVVRKAVGNDRTGCQIATGLSVVRRDGTWLDIPHGFDHETVGPEIAETVGVPLDAHEVREC